MRILYISNFSELSTENILLLNSIAEESREEFNNYIGELNHLNKNNIFWWANPVSSRNTYLDKSYENYCKLKLIIRLLDSDSFDKVDTNIEILYNLLLAKYGNQKVVKKKFFNLYNNIFKKIISIIRLIGYQSIKYFSIRIITYFFNIRQNNNKLIIETFIYNKSFNPDFLDRHFPYLESYLGPEIFNKSLYLPNFYGVKNFFSTLLLIKKSKFSFTLAERHICLYDFLKCLFYFINTSCSPKFKTLTNTNHNLSEIIKFSYNHNLISIDSSNSLMRYFSIKGMARSGMCIDTFLMWFENISINKMTKMALTRFFPDSRCIGYQGIFTSPNNIGNYLIKEDAECNVLPDTIGFMGAKLIPEKNVNNSIIMPAFRYLAVFKSKNYYANIKCSSNNILVALPVNIEESDRIIGFINEYRNELDLKFFFKPHPATNKKRIEYEILKYNFCSDQIINSKINLTDYRLVVTSGSGIAIESLLSCVPVVIIGSRINLTLNPIPSDFLKSYWKLVFDQNQFSSFLEFLFSKNFDRQSLIDQIFLERNNYCSELIKTDSIFSPVLINNLEDNE